MYTAAVDCHLAYIFACILLWYNPKSSGIVPETCGGMIAI